MFCQEWCCFYDYCGGRGHFVTHSLGIYGSNLTNETDVGLYWYVHVIWEYIWRLKCTGETPHKCKQCDITSIIASHLKMHNKKDACLISGLFSHPTATHPWSVLEACRWLFQDKQREKDLSNHSIVPRDKQVSFFLLLELFVFDDFICYDGHLMTTIIYFFSSN